MIHLLLPYIILAVGLIAGLVLFVSMKCEVRSSTATSRKRIDEIAQRVEHAQNHEPDPVYNPVPHRPGFNISKRIQAMRMLRRNEDISHISAALGVTRKEVELLIRVQKLSAESVVKARSSSAISV